ncbi:MAG: insulinase family protein [Reinekea sp.]|jgi:insulysin
MKPGAQMALGISVVIVLAVAGWFSYPLLAASEQANPSNIEVSANEDRIFKSIELKNGIKALLVSDADSDKAAAAINVFTGSWSDPDDIPGMAHYLEHMLFLGTEKFPDVDDYHTFIEQNGGRNNAYTSTENTLYYFDINATALEPALDRLSQFFIAPLFEEEFADRERNAVNSEYSASLNRDYRRIEDAVREVTSKQHPASRLTIGNIETLQAEHMSQRLKRFFRENYVANNMSLVIYGPQSISDMEALANQYFNGIRDVDHKQTRFLQPQFDASELPMLLELKPKKELRYLEFRFPIGPTTPLLATKPGTYIAHLLGHESSGSLLSTLKEKGWAETLSARTESLTDSNTTFSVSIQLTPEGLAHWSEVGERLFANINLIAAEGIQPRIYEELKNLSEISFQFAEQSSAIHVVTTLAERLRYYPQEQVLSGPYQLAEFDPEAVKRFLSQLKPDNVLVVLANPDAETDQVSQYYNTPYHHTTLAGNQAATWRNPGNFADLHIPQPNPFVPSQLAVAPMEKEPSGLFSYHPQRIAITDNSTIWFEQDDEFRTPKTDIHLLLETPFPTQSADNLAATTLYMQLVNDALSEVAYEAGLAGSGYRIGLSDRGIEIRLYGYQDKLHLMLDTLVLELAEHKINADRFAIKREEYLRRLRNQKDDPVMSQIMRELNLWMTSDSFDNASQVAAVEKLTTETLIQARESWLTSAKLKMLIHGNLTDADAQALAERVDKVLPQQGTEEIHRKVAQLPNKDYLLQMNIDHQDSAFMQLYQGDNSSLRERALYALLADIISAPYFGELRTREQLGYIVTARHYSLEYLPGLLLYIQSPSTDPALLQLYSDRFLSRFEQQLINMNENNFDTYKQGLITNLTAPKTNLYTLSNSYWSDIQVGNSNFNTAQRLATEVERISLDGFRRFYGKRIINNKTRSITIHQIGTNMVDDYNKHKDNIVGYYPLTGTKNWPDDVSWIQPTFNNQ